MSLLGSSMVAASVAVGQVGVEQTLDELDKREEGREQAREALSDFYLAHKRFRDAQLEEATLADAQLIGMDLTFASLNRAILDDAFVLNSDLDDAYLRGIRFVEGDLSVSSAQEADFCRADLSDAELSYTEFAGANFESALLYGADLTRADGLNTASLERARYDDETAWPANFDPVAAGAVRDPERGRPDDQDEIWRCY